VQKAVSIMANGKSASKKPSGIPLNLTVTCAKLIQPIDVRVWQTAHFPQELCLKRRISGLAVNKAVCLQLFHSTLHPGHIRAAMPEELPDENLDFL
jgi:hypothetical protein